MATELYSWRAEHNFKRSRELQSILYLFWNSNPVLPGAPGAHQGRVMDLTNPFFQALSCCCGEEEHLLRAWEGLVTVVPMPEIKWWWYTNVNISRYKWRCPLKCAWHGSSETISNSNKIITSPGAAVQKSAALQVGCRLWVRTTKAELCIF